MYPPPAWVRIVVLRYLAKIVFLKNKSSERINTTPQMDAQRSPVKLTQKVDPNDANNVLLVKINSHDGHADAESSTDDKSEDNSDEQNRAVIRGMSKDLSYIVNSIKKEKQDDCVASDWKAIARVVDRTMFYICTIIFIIVLAVTFIIVLE